MKLSTPLASLMLAATAVGCADAEPPPDDAEVTAQELGSGDRCGLQRFSGRTRSGDACRVSITFGSPVNAGSESPGCSPSRSFGGNLTVFSPSGGVKQIETFAYREPLSNDVIRGEPDLSAGSALVAPIPATSTSLSDRGDEYTVSTTTLSYDKAARRFDLLKKGDVYEAQLITGSSYKEFKVGRLKEKGRTLAALDCTISP